ncbi:hypothetical protein CMO92_03140 [Candidatus Woesearchaeota archaeon]|nr:hypothetical protein [Candidatus Woesearchaeota archaeon]|tara:strand:+ start:354 stop:866 length:513 start_codon:yes stop_codon:yes gene_type:complete
MEFATRSNLEESLEDEEAKEKTLSYFEETKAWQEHKKKHKNANLHLVEEKEELFHREQTESGLRRDQEETPRPKEEIVEEEEAHEKEHKVMKAGCGCGEFQMAINSEKRTAYTIGGEEDSPEEKIYGMSGPEPEREDRLYKGPDGGEKEEGGTGDLYNREAGAAGSKLYK